MLRFSQAAGFIYKMQRNLHSLLSRGIGVNAQLLFFN